MNRRDLLVGAAAGLVVGAGVTAAVTLGRKEEKMAEAPAAPAVAKGVKELKMVTSWPKNFPGLGTAANRLAQRITDISDGRYQVKVFAGGELVHALKCLDALQEGTADLYHSAEYYYQGKSKAFNFFAAVPLGLTATEHAAWIYHGGGQALWDKLSGAFNVKPLLAGNTGVQMGGWFRKEMNTLEDFKGLKMRIPGLGGAVITALGGTSVTLAGGEIFQALQAGTIDATEWVGPWNDLAFGFYKVAKYHYYPGFHEPGTALSLGIRRDFWDGLSEADKALFHAAAGAENDYDLAEFNAKSSAALETLINEHGVQLREFSDEIFKAVGEVALGVVAEVGQTDATTKGVYDSFNAFRTLAKGWSAISEQAYLNKRALVLS